MTSPMSDYEGLLGKYQRGDTGQKRAEKEPPYQALLSLASEIGKLDETLDRLPERACEPPKKAKASRTKESLLIARRARLILEWCNSHGTLGILPHRLLSLARPTVATIGIRRRGGARVFLDSAGWIRSPEGWHEAVVGHAFLRLPLSDPWLDNIDPTPPAGDYRALVSASALSELAERMPHEATRLASVVAAATMSDLPYLLAADPDSATTAGTAPIERVLLSDPRWTAFFPGISPANGEVAYPEPLSEQFWRHYGESVEHFLKVAQSFKLIAELDLRKDISGPGRQQALRVLNAMVAGVQPLLVPGEKGLRQTWSFPSLISAFAWMLSRDLASGRFHSCKACGTPFASTAYQAKYCSERCRWAGQKRRQRKNQSCPPKV